MHFEKALLMSIQYCQEDTVGSQLAYLKFP